jgi:hypothetical protein
MYHPQNQNQNQKTSFGIAIREIRHSVYINSGDCPFQKMISLLDPLNHNAIFARHRQLTRKLPDFINRTQ